MAPKNVTELFNKFAGRELKDPGRVTCDIDSTLGEIEQVAKDNGLKLRIWFPGTVGTMDYRTDRINVHVEKDAAGKFIVSDKFKIG